MGKKKYKIHNNFKKIIEKGLDMLSLLTYYHQNMVWWYTDTLAKVKMPRLP